MYKITFTKQAFQKLKKLPKNLQRIIRKRIEDLAKDPYAPNNNATKLQGIDGYRLRVGDWRVIYHIDNNQLVIEIIKIASRGEVYS